MELRPARGPLLAAEVVEKRLEAAQPLLQPAEAVDAMAGQTRLEAVVATSNAELPDGATFPLPGSFLPLP